ncbi:RNA-processing protein, HAT helix [Corchorus capsularis]|uniref:RNA-processing protein, HAT helix n=1 Tax=Corchorus capsularis TaxID=210143 RepID=A0A1R3IVK1_COCAP|nr:RNA-processing protein, HAT helix [Corchorus capsularis]
MLRSAPSFSVFPQGVEDDGEVGEEKLVRTVTIGDNIDAIGNADFSFMMKKELSMQLIQEEGEEEEERPYRFQRSYNEEVDLEPPSPPMYLATGLGIDAMADGIDLSSIDLDENGDPEQFHKRLVDEYPCHPLFLRNYAKFLQSKGDLHGAEDFYHRATLADPENGEILMQYAKIVWELHQDKDVALSYFERAVQASPQDSNVLGAYANFLWEIEDDEEKTEPASPSLRPPNPAGFANHAVDLLEVKNILDVDIEDYYRRMVKENHSNPLVLSNYARFLHESKGDLEGAEGYYSQAIQADPSDGETMSKYAKLVWDLHHDHGKASHYFERAVEATPENSHVLAAYASFLWEADEDEEDNTRQDQTQVSLQHGTLFTINS